jgi:hypothetical protein
VTRQKDPQARMSSYLDKYRKLAARLAEIGFIWPGHIQRRWLKCGKPTCACHEDPEARHGPYAYWTSKKDRKTVSRLLSPEEADLLEEWVQNRRGMEAIIRQMKTLSRKAAAVALRLRTESAEAD